MLRYSLEFIDTAGSVIGTLEFLSPGDADALEEAAAARDRLSMRLWQDGREVAVFLPASDLYILAPDEADVLEAC